MAITTDANGYTVVTPEAGSRVIYVSQSDGLDSNSGLSSAAPKQTIAAGKALLRDGQPDMLLLKRGDTFTGAPFGQVRTSGASASAPMVIGAYGSGPRPIVIHTGEGFVSRTNGGGVSTDKNHVYVLDIDMRPSSPQTGSYGVGMFSPCDGWHVENCIMRNYADAFASSEDGTVAHYTNLVIRRNVMIDSQAPGYNKAQGIFLGDADTVLIEDNFIDRASNVLAENMDILGHAIYVSNGVANLTARGNITARSGSHGIQARDGGTIYEHVSVGDSIGILCGGGDDPPAGGVTGTVERCIIVEGKDITASKPRGWGIDIENAADVSVSDCIIANRVSAATDGHAIEISNKKGIGIVGCTVSQCIVYNYGAGIRLTNEFAPAFTGIELTANDLIDGLSTRRAPLVYSGVALSGVTFTNNAYFAAYPDGQWFAPGGVNRTFDQWLSGFEATAQSGIRAELVNPDIAFDDYCFAIGVGDIAGFRNARIACDIASHNAALFAPAIVNFYRTQFGLDADPPPPPPPPGVSHAGKHALLRRIIEC